MAKEGSTIGGLMDCFGTAVSMSLQYGVPLEVYVNKFSHTRFEPMGHTKNPDIRIAKSIVDYIFRWLGINFLPGYREANQAVPVRRRWPATAPAAGRCRKQSFGPPPRRPAGRRSGKERPSGTARPTATATARPTVRRPLPCLAAWPPFRGPLFLPAPQAGDCPDFRPTDAKRRGAKMGTVPFG